jgi:hypothetical protein
VNKSAIVAKAAATDEVINIDDMSKTSEGQNKDFRTTDQHYHYHYHTQSILTIPMKNHGFYEKRQAH